MFGVLQQNLAKDETTTLGHTETRLQLIVDSDASHERQGPWASRYFAQCLQDPPASLSDAVGRAHAQHYGGGARERAGKSHWIPVAQERTAEMALPAATPKGTHKRRTQNGCLSGRILYRGARSLGLSIALPGFEPPHFRVRSLVPRLSVIEVKHHPSIPSGPMSTGKIFFCTWYDGHWGNPKGRPPPPPALFTCFLFFGSSCTAQSSTPSFTLSQAPHQLACFSKCRT